MPTCPEYSAISAAVSRVTRAPCQVTGYTPSAGGCINETGILTTSHERWFVKMNAVPRLPMFEAEHAALDEIRASGTVRAPKPIATGTCGGRAFLVMECLELRPLDAESEVTLAQGLAAMHRHTRGVFGWSRDNTIGSTPQHNAPSSSWVEFFRERRLRFQLELAAARGAPHALVDRGAELLDRLPAFFSDYDPSPSLLHGDLWSGNVALCGDDPIIFDPATYYGDREADIAMTELFGGFSGRFYAAYREAWPLDAGYPVRRDLYNLYHVVNHFNLFGGSYARQARELVDRLLSAAR